MLSKCLWMKRKKPESPGFYSLRNRREIHLERTPFKHLFRGSSFSLTPPFLCLLLACEVLSTFLCGHLNLLLSHQCGHIQCLLHSWARAELYLSPALLPMALAAQTPGTSFLMPSWRKTRGFLKQKNPVSHWPSLTGLLVTSGPCRVHSVPPSRVFVISSCPSWTHSLPLPSGL